MQSNRIRLISVTALAVAAVSSASALQIVLVPNATLTGNTAALAAFQRAAAHWESAFSDNITVTINAGLSNLGGGGVIGSTGSTTLQASYGTIRNQMIADATPYTNNAIVASLPTSLSVNTTSTSVSGNVSLTKANAKALGFTGLDASFGVSDATINFNTQFSFDFNRADGQTAGAMDFETVAEHEIGHALGFISGVDTASASTVQLTTLDLFRFASAPTTAAQFATNAREMRPGATAFFGDTTNSYELERGTTYQASHWRADELSGNFIGIMDPSIDFGQFYDYTAADLRAFDLIGWDVRVQATPEPATLAALGLGTLAFLRRRKRSA